MDRNDGSQRWIATMDRGGVDLTVVDSCRTVSYEFIS